MGLFVQKAYLFSGNLNMDRYFCRFILRKKDGDV